MPQETELSEPLGPGDWLPLPLPLGVLAIVDPFSFGWTAILKYCCFQLNAPNDLRQIT